MLRLSYEDKETSIRGLASMTERQQVAFLCWVVGFNQEETAGLMGIAQQVAGRHLQKALKKMRALGKSGV